MASGLKVIEARLAEDRTAICAPPRYAHQPERQAYRAGHTPSQVVLGSGNGTSIVEGDSMRAPFRWLGLVVVSLGIPIGSLALGARYYDGPISVFAGGPLKSGEVTPVPNDWSFLRDRDTVQLQTLNPAISRTIWFVVHDRRLCFTSGDLKWDEDHGLAEYGRPGLISKLKRWPYQIENDNRIILRIDEKLYEQRLQRVTS